MVLQSSIYHMAKSEIDYQIMARRWRDSALSELKPAHDLMATGNPRQALFWAHLALEKILKAHVVQQTHQHAPFTHALPRLAMLAGLDFSELQYSMLDELNAYQVETRYGDTTSDSMIVADSQYAQQMLDAVEEMVQWLARKL
jgi:HEPN domain-containing protein